MVAKLGFNNSKEHMNLYLFECYLQCQPDNMSLGKDFFDYVAGEINFVRNIPK